MEKSGNVSARSIDESLEINHFILMRWKDQAIFISGLELQAFRIFRIFN